MAATSNRNLNCAFGFLALTVATCSAPSFVSADPGVSALLGSWSGNGRISYTDGTSESINCNAYYTGSGSDLRMAIQCKSERNPIHVRSRLRISGTRASGEWEERTFNASGTASGTAGSNSLSLGITGGGFTGSMSVSFSQSTQNVVINTQGIAMSRATMNFSRR